MTTNLSFYIALGALMMWTGFAMLKRPINPLLARITAIAGFTLLWGSLWGPPYPPNELALFYATKPIAFISAIIAGIFVTKTAFKKV